MADNVAITAGSGITIAADDISGVHHQRVKISQGADGSATDVSSAAPLQVTLANTAANTNKLLVTPDLPSGASTAAKQPALGTAGSASTDVITVQGIASGTVIPVSDGSGSLTVDYATTGSGTATGALRVELPTNGTGVIATVGAVTSLTNALPAGNNNIGDVDVASIAAGNNNIGDVDIASIAAGDNNIGNVDVLTVITGTGATNLGKAEDAVHASGDTGVMALAVRSDAGTVTAADGDYVPLLVNSAGALYVTGGGGGTQYVEDAAAAADPTGTAIMGIRRDTLSASEVSADGDNVAIKATSKGQLHVFADPGTAAANLGKAEDAVHSSGDVGVMSLAVRNDAGTAVAADGDYIPLTVNSAGALYVTGGGGGTQYVEDAAAAADPTGTVVMGVRRDTLATNEVSADGDNIAIKATNKGQMHVFAETGTLTVASHAVTNAGTFATQSAVTAASGSIASGAVASGAVASGAFASGSIASGAIASGAIAAGAIAAGATSIADNEDVASADGDRGVKILFKRLDSPANSSGTSGDYEQPQMSAGRIWTSTLLDTALPAGTNAIGKLSANSGVDIGDVDVTTVGTITPGTAATSLGKAEDAAHTSGDVGVMALAIRQDSESVLAGTTGDYIPLSVNSNGYLRVTLDPRQTDGSEYVLVAASQTDAVIQISTGATGDFLSHVEVFPGTAGCGVVTIKDLSTTWGTFPGGGTTALPTLVPFTIPVGVNSVNGAWKITTGANVTCVAVGNFS